MRTSQSFIVRIWLEPDTPRPLWRASVTDAGSVERRFFSSPEALVAFLRTAPEALFAPEADDFTLKERL